MNPDDILDTSRLCFEGCFDEQVHNILQRVRLTRYEVQNLRLLMDDLQVALQRLAPGCEVFPFGSIVTGLGIRTSDVDCFVQLPPGMAPTAHCVTQAKAILMKNRAKFTNLFAITAAKVPILKFQHVPTHCDCDVSFSSPFGVQNSELLAFLLQMDGRALTMAIIIKYWSKVYNFTGTNLMPNYALSLLVIFYLQVKNILPSVSVLQHNLSSMNSFIIENWETGFNVNVCCGTNNNESLYELLGGFFEYYSNFNFEQNVISPYLGHVVSKKLFERLETVPNELGLYKLNVSNKACRGLRVDTLICVQDPFDHSRNCSVAIYPRLMEKIMSHFHFAAQVFGEASGNHFLRVILTEDATPALDAGIVNTHDKKKHVFNNKIRKHIPKRNHGLANRGHPQQSANKRSRAAQFKFGLKNNLTNMYKEMHRMMRGNR